MGLSVSEIGYNFGNKDVFRKFEENGVADIAFLGFVRGGDLLFKLVDDLNEGFHLFAHLI